MPDIWTSANAYEAYMAGWSKAVAAKFLAWLDVPPHGAWLDVGCGTGALTQTIVATAQPSKVLGIDPSDAFIARAREANKDPRVSFQRGNAQELIAGANFDAAVSGLVLNFLPDPAAALSNVVQTMRLGGIVGAYVWDYADEMELMRYFWDAARELDPAAEELDEGRTNSICHPDALASLFASRLSAVEVTELIIPTVFRNFDAYWQPFLGGVGTAPAYVVALGDDQRVALRESLRARLPTSPDGSIELRARAFAVKGLSV